MPNPLYNLLTANTQAFNDGGFSSFVNEFNNFRKSFKGNPKQKVQELLNSGQMSQEQFNMFSQIANQMSQLTK